MKTSMVIKMTAPQPLQSSQAPMTATPFVSTSHLPRLEPLKFIGKVEEYPEFKRNWLSRLGRLDNDMQLQYLRPALPSKDQ